MSMHTAIPAPTATIATTATAGSSGAATLDTPAASSPAPAADAAPVGDAALPPTGIAPGGAAVRWVMAATLALVGLLILIDRRQR